MVWMQVAVFALFIIAGTVWILSIYAGLEEGGSDAVLYSLWTGLMILAVGVAVREWWIPNPEFPAVAGVIVGIGFTVVMLEPELNGEQTA